MPFFAGVTVIAIGLPLAHDLDDDRAALRGVDERQHLVAVVDLLAVDRARSRPRAGGRPPRPADFVDQLADDRRLAQAGHAPGEEDADDHERGEEVVGRRPGEDGRQPLPHRAVRIGARIVGSHALFAGVEPRDLDEAAERDGGDLIDGLAALEAEQLRTEADGEAIDAHARQARDEEVAALVDDDEDAERQDGEQDRSGRCQ